MGSGVEWDTQVSKHKGRERWFKLILNKIPLPSGQLCRGCHQDFSNSGPRRSLCASLAMALLMPLVVDSGPRFHICTIWDRSQMGTCR